MFVTNVDELKISRHQNVGGCLHKALRRKHCQHFIGLTHSPSQRLLLITYKSERREGNAFARKQSVQIDKISIKQTFDKRNISVIRIFFIHYINFDAFPLFMKDFSANRCKPLFI